MADSGAPDRRRARLEVLGAAVLFSTGGAAIKGTALTAWQVAGVRSLVAALALLVLLPEARRHWRLRSVVVGAFYATTLILFVLANKLTTAANAIYLQAVGPLVVMVVAPLGTRRTRAAPGRAVRGGHGRRPRAGLRGPAATPGYRSESVCRQHRGCRQRTRLGLHHRRSTVDGQPRSGRARSTASSSATSLPRSCACRLDGRSRPARTTG